MILRTDAGVALDLRKGSRDLEAYNVELVRGYVEKHPDHVLKQIAAGLNLDRRTVTKALSAMGAARTYEIGLARRR